MANSEAFLRTLPRRAYHKSLGLLLKAEFAVRERQYNARPVQVGVPVPRLHGIPRHGAAGTTCPPAPPVQSYGFVPEDRARNWEDLSVHEGDPGHVRVEDVLYLPSGHEWSRSGLYHEDGSPVPASLTHEGVRRMNGFDTLGNLRPEDVAVEEREVVYVGFLKLFGHFISETMGLLRVRDQLERPEEALWLFHGVHPATTSWGRQFLQALDIPPERLISFSRPTRLKRAIVPHAGLVLNDSIWTATTAFTAAIGARVMGHAPRRTDQPLYLSRSKVPMSKRVLGNERALEAWLAERGALIYHPEDHPLAHQIRTVHSHRTVIGGFGAAQFLGLFSPEPTRNIYFSSMLAPATYMLIDAVKGSESIWIRTAEMACRLKRLKPGESMHLQNVIIDLPMTQAILTDHGL